jgi:hypothetical protein
MLDWCDLAGFDLMWVKSVSRVARCRFSRTLEDMEAHFSPDPQAKIDRLVAQESLKIRIRA